MDSLAGQPVATDDGGGVDIVLDQLLCMLQQLCSQDHLHSTYGMYNVHVYIHDPTLSH